MGGSDGVALQHSKGKLTARERIERFFDAGTFAETGALTGSATYDESGALKDFTPSNIVIGKGRVGGRKVVVSADDFTIRGGSSEATSPDKWQYAERLAQDLRLPLVRLVDMAGGSVRLLEKSQATKIPGYAHWDWVNLLSVVPVVGAACGPCAGFGAWKVVASHFSIMIEGVSQVFAAGPPVVEPGIGESVTKEELGGADIHARHSGVVDNVAADEDDALHQIRSFLSFLPPSVFSLPARTTPSDDPARREEALLSIIPRQRRRGYKVRDLIEFVLDRDSLFEIGRYWGRSTVTALARLDGYPVGVVANDPFHYGGGMDEHAAEKLNRFVDLCDTFHLPVVNFVDQPGTVIGTAAEKRATIRKAVRALAAIDQASVPWCSVMIRRAFGVAGVGYAPLRGLNLRYAWPSGAWGSIPIEGGVYAAHKREIEAADDPRERVLELQQYYERFASPFRTAERFGVQDIIDPRDTRPLLCDWIEEAYALLPEHLGVTRRAFRP
jgi:acetyl-CoA carboxylase carboxyltransferase component